MPVEFHTTNGNWVVYGRTYVRGKVLVGDEVQPPETLDRIFSRYRPLSDILQSLKDLNGHYSIVHLGEQEVYAVVDRNRGLPLFYGHDGMDVFVSDDAFWVQERMNDYSIDERSKREFLLTGYVTNDRTLVGSVKQVRSGEVVHIALEQVKGAVIERGQYQQYLPKDYFPNDMEAGLKELDKVLVNSFRRLIEHAQGRTIVVPLSGGYDSRLIVLMLKRFGYEKVVAFTYGRLNNKESEVSREVASALGVRWEFVEYTNEKWFEWFNSDAYNDFCLMGSGLASSPYIQDFPAVMMLKQRGLVPDDCLLVAGHTVSICNPDLKGDLKRMDLAVDDVITNHFNINGRPIEDPMLLQEARENVAEYLGDLSRYPDRNSAEECWDFNNRQSKFTNNNVRVYEYWGYDWWLPLVDKEFMDFWVRVPYELRLGRPLYKAYVKKMSLDLCGRDIPFFLKAMKTQRMKRMTSWVQEKEALSRLVGYFFYSQRKARLFNEHPQAFFGMIPWEQYKKEFTGREVINYFIAYKFVEKIEKYLREKEAQRTDSSMTSGKVEQGGQYTDLTEGLASGVSLSNEG